MNKVNIRSITLGLNEKDIFNEDIHSKIQNFYNFSEDNFSKNNFNIRTKRISMSPINEIDKNNIPKSKEIVKTISSICESLGIRWFCVPFSTFGDTDLRHLNSTMIDVIKRYPSAFVNVIVVKDNNINFRGINLASHFVKSVSQLSSTGYDNFRVGISCNVNANTPFFPFTYQNGETNFSLALELTNIFIDIVKNISTSNLEEVKNKISDLIIPQLIGINKVAKKIESETGIKFSGIDSSLAPLPQKDSSVAQLIELLGVECFGNNGTLFLTSFLTNLIKDMVYKSEIESVGFNGVMFSHLEDSGMGKRNNTRSFSIDSLLSYSSVCGCGIDMVPIPGNSFEEEISSLILDVAGISSVWNKPLGVRLLPIPMKNENEYTNFNHDFLYNTRIKALGNQCINPTILNNDIFSY